MWKGLCRTGHPPDSGFPGGEGRMSQMFSQIPFQLLCDFKRGHRALS